MALLLFLSLFVAILCLGGMGAWLITRRFPVPPKELAGVKYGQTRTGVYRLSLPISCRANFKLRVKPPAERQQGNTFQDMFGVQASRPDVAALVGSSTNLRELLCEYASRFNNTIQFEISDEKLAIEFSVTPNHLTAVEERRTAAKELAQSLGALLADLAPNSPAQTRAERRANNALVVPCLTMLALAAVCQLLPTYPEITGAIALPLAATGLLLIGASSYWVFSSTPANQSAKPGLVVAWIMALTVTLSSAQPLHSFVNRLVIAKVTEHTVELRSLEAIPHRRTPTTYLVHVRPSKTLPERVHVSAAHFYKLHDKQLPPGSVLKISVAQGLLGTEWVNAVVVASTNPTRLVHPPMP